MSRTVGQHEETRALHYLQQQGLKFITQNYHCKAGEIDLIMQDQETLVFIEVRYRSNSTRGDGLESITPQKQQKIIQSAKHYLQQQRLIDKVYCRFDVIGIDQPHDILWLKDAFQT